MGSDISAPDPNLLPVQKITLPEFMATINKIMEASPLKWIDETIYRGDPTLFQTRVQPGQLVINDQSTVIETYLAWIENDYSSTGVDSSLLFQFILMITCTAFKGWHDYPLYGRLYCYDNVWSDALGLGGAVTGGPQGF